MSGVTGLGEAGDDAAGTDFLFRTGAGDPVPAEDAGLRGAVQ